MDWNRNAGRRENLRRLKAYKQLSILRTMTSPLSEKIGSIGFNQWRLCTDFNRLRDYAMRAESFSAARQTARSEE
jgi:hypothetical protein